MSKDKRAEIVETMAQGIHDHWQNAPGPHARSWGETCKKFPTMADHFRSKASVALDIALKAAAGEVQRLSDEWHKEWRAGHKANTYLEGKSDGADECANAILALTSKGVKE